MKLQRRNFLKLAAALGASTLFPAVPSFTHAATTTPNRFFVMVNAGGGWDPTSFCDPKGNAPRDDGRGPVNHYVTDNIVQLENSPIHYAPFPDPTILEEVRTSALRTDMPISNFTGFFEKYASKMLIINGIDTQTVSHSVGSRNTWSGSDKEGFPSFAALFAAATAPGNPMSFISNGGYDFTDGLVSSSRVNDATVFQQLAFTNRLSPTDTSRHFFKPSILDRINREKLIRLNQSITSTTLSQRRVALAKRLNVQDDGLAEIVDRLEQIQQSLPNAELSRGLKGQAELAAAAFAAGISASANLSLGGFDTHGNHDRDHTNSLANLIDGVDHLWQMLELVGIADKTTVIMGSDFGRTPYYNDGQGKDHWNITSMIFMGAGISGNRVIGGTNSRVEALKINPTSFEIMTDQADEAGIKLTPAHIHIALRKLASIEDSVLLNQYGISKPFLNLL